MKAIIQQAKKITLTIEDTKQQLGEKGIILYICFEQNDDNKTTKKFVEKIVKQRILTNEQGKIGRKISTVEETICVVPNFTLAGSFKKNGVPDFSQSKHPQDAKKIYACFCEEIQKYYSHCIFGEFGSYMEITATVLGPINYIFSSENQ